MRCMMTEGVTIVCVDLDDNFQPIEPPIYTFSYKGYLTCAQIMRPFNLYVRQLYAHQIAHVLAKATDTDVTELTAKVEAAWERFLADSPPKITTYQEDWR